MGPRQQAVIIALSAVRQARQRATALTDSELETLEAALLAAGADPEGPPEIPAGLDALVRMVSRVMV